MDAALLELRAQELIGIQFALGWAETIRASFGLCIDFAGGPEEVRRQLLAPIRDLDRSGPLVADFSLDGSKLLQPNDPAKSLLYHLWARGEFEDSPECLAVDQLDILENYIFWLGQDDPGCSLPDDAIFATLAYSYRPARSTPHGRHADLVYSRTAITRIGTFAPLFSPSEQCWVNWFDSGEGSPGFRVTRARFAVFVCRRVLGNGVDASLMSRTDGDECRLFILPIRKVFVGAKLPGLATIEKLSYRMFFLGDKLKRVVEFSGAHVPSPLDINMEPFMVTSRLEVEAGGPPIADAHIEAVPLQSGIIVGPLARIELIRVATQTVLGATHIARFEVPPRRDPVLGFLRGTGMDSGNISWNRHYTSMLIAPSQTKLAFEGLLEDLEHMFPRWLYPLPKVRSRPAPEFVNIRHRVNSDLEIEALSVTLDQDYESTLDGGGYEAALFDDGMFDGAVWALVNGSPVLPAFTVVTAPDFFPNADQVDIQTWAASDPEHNAANQFKEGGPAPLSAGRFAANPLLFDPWTKGRLFRPDDDTVTAIVARPARLARGRGQPRAQGHLRRHGSGFLSDSASNEFAPGWDVSYDTYEGRSYYTTHGLGSPFPEDVKFCASANAYWAAASPDAARTFKRPHVPTAIPMLDVELGLHPGCDLNGRISSPGWDGEFGPFFQRDASGQLGVNFADIRRSDYVTNALQGQFAKQIYSLTSDQLVQRMEALRLCLQRLPIHSDSAALTPYWLVSASQMLNAVGEGQGPGTTLCFEFCIPCDNEPVSACTPLLAPSEPGYWRLWQRVSRRVKIECSFESIESVMPIALRHAEASDGSSIYGPWASAPI